MKFPTTSEDVKNEIFEAVNKIENNGDLKIRQLSKILEKVNDEIIIEGIIAVFENKNRPYFLYSDQKYAGQILQKNNPTTNLNPEIILNRTLKNWNKSVFELPFWMEENYGIEILKKTFKTYRKENLSELESDQLNTLEWWLKLAP